MSSTICLALLIDSSLLDAIFTIPSSLTSSFAPETSTMFLITLPPEPITSFILALSIVIEIT